MSANRRAKTLAWVGLVSATFFWACNAVWARFTANVVPPLDLALGRWLLAAGCLLPLTARGLWRARDTLRQHAVALLGLSVLGISAFNSLIYLAARSTPALNIALINSTTPLVIALLARLMLKQKTRPIQNVGVALGLVGIAVTLGAGGSRGLGAIELGPGDLWLLAAVLAWSFYSILLGRVGPLGRALPRLELLSVQVLAGAVLLAPVAWWMRGDLAGYAITPELTAGWIFLAIGPSILAYLGWGYGVSVLGAPVSAAFLNLIPVFTAGLALLWLGEPIEARHLAGAACIGVGLLLATRRPASDAAV